MDMGKQTIKNIKERHAFCILGEETIFLCHQIMTHMEPHSYELILEVEIPEEAKQKIFDDRAKTGKTHYFGNKEDGLFTLPSIVAGKTTEFMADVWNSLESPQNPATELKKQVDGVMLPPATLPQPPWAGYWGKPAAEPWLKDVKVTIKRVVHYRHLNQNEVSRKFEEYVLFGRGEEAHIMHSVIWQPDYDHVATLKEAPDWLDEDQLVATVNISFPRLPYDNYSTYCENPIEDKTRHLVRYQGLTEYRDPFGNLQNKLPKLYIEVEHTWWFSTRIINFWNYQYCHNSKQIS